jgi:rRNA maturation endonuclease Nob1
MSVLTRLRTVFTSSEKEESHAYACLGCEACFRVQRQVCPECGGYSIERTDWVLGDA